MADEASALSAVFGAAKGGEKSSPMAASEPSESAVPEDFEDYALTAFPDLEGDPERIEALYNAMMVCAGE